MKYIVGALLSLLLLVGPAAADTGAGSGTTGFNAHSGSTVAPQPVPATSGTSNAGDPRTDVVVIDVCAMTHDPQCLRGCGPGTRLYAISTAADQADGVGVSTATCLASPTPAAHVTPFMVLSAFRRIPVPTPALHIQPVKGRTLVNFRTNFYATGGAPFTRTVHLLGHAVTLRIHVQSYDYRFGDGQHLSTSTAGEPFPHLTNTHRYLHKGVVRPSLTTVWAADYRVDGGDWREVDGTVTKNDPAQRLEVLTATPVLVGH